jgi:hypothetical protein
MTTKIAYPNLPPQPLREQSMADAEAQWLAEMQQPVVSRIDLPKPALWARLRAWLLPDKDGNLLSDRWVEARAQELLRDPELQRRLGFKPGELPPPTPKR